MKEKFLVLMKSEWIKISHYRSFQILTLAYIVILMLVYIFAQRFVTNITIQSNDTAIAPFARLSFYHPQSIWQNFTYVAAYFKIFPALLIILLITNEFSFFTMRQQLISGMSRKDFIAGKLLVVFMLSLGIVLLIGVAGFILGTIHQGTNNISLINKGIWFLPIHLLELVTYLSCAMLVAFMLRRSGIAIIAFVLYSLIGERILKFLMPGDSGDYLPLNAAGSLIPLPNNEITTLMGLSFRNTIEISTVATCLFYCCLFTVLVYLIIRWRDA
ncbi:MAG: ABC transporter permease subunit [Lentimicrobiaceae bacterium]|nr:ABC transporter permease subunit [Lentimicrobiaceae bacterium]